MPKAKPKKAAKVSRKARPRRRASERGDLAVETALASLAHDIRTPLTGILALAELIYASDLPERERRWAGAIKNAAEHLAQLTTLVVDAAKAGATGLILRPEPFSPRDIAEATAASLAARAEGKSLKVRVSIDKDLPELVTGDAVRLRTALENLIDNAVKFTEQGNVELAVSSKRAANGKVRLAFAVTDSGIGIVASDLKTLFRPFAQASEDVARRFGGAGLGLAFVKRLATVMGGRLTVTSKPGIGSTFELTVLVEKPARGRPRASARAGKSMNILCVEDNPYGRVVLNAVLGELGHRVSFVGSGELAVETVRRGGHDVVFMDIALSDIDGLEATRRIRQLPPPAGQIPIIGLSGRTQQNDAAAARAAGMDAYLRKPASPAGLNAALEAVATRSRKR